MEARTEPTSFEYRRADSWEDAELLRHLGRRGEDHRRRTEPRPMLNLRLTMLGALINIKEIGVEGDPCLEDGDDGTVVVVPALTTHARVMASGVVAEHSPMLYHAVRLVGNVRVRSRGTFGGSIAHTSLATMWVTRSIRCGRAVNPWRRHAGHRLPLSEERPMVEERVFDALRELSDPVGHACSRHRGGHR